jgi:uncharacterized protein YdiU (UPF0061 family)
MNRQFYEFWASFFTNASQGQKQIDDASALMKQGFDGWSDLTALFMRSYGLKPPQSENYQASPAWQKAIADFQDSFSQFAAQWGWISQSEHQKVLEKCGELEKKVEAQQATITQLRGLLAQEGLGYTELIEHLKGSFKDQSEQFQAIMENIGKLGKDKS